MYLSLIGLTPQFPFFYGRAAFSRIWREVPFCHLLSKDSVLLFPGAWLTWRPSLANICPELKILFQISSDEKVLFWHKRVWSIIWLFLLPLFSSSQATTMTYIPFSVQPIIGHGVQAAFGLHSYLPFNGQSWDLLVQTQSLGELIFLFPLSVTYHITLNSNDFSLLGFSGVGRKRFLLKIHTIRQCNKSKQSVQLGVYNCDVA